MGRATGGASAWRALYLADRNELVLSRLRWCVALSLVGVLMLLGQVVVLRPQLMATRLQGALSYATVCLAAGAASFVPGARRRATPLALGYVLMLLALMAASLPWIPTEVDTAPASMVALIMGTTLLLPWGAPPQAVVCAASVAAFGWLRLHVDGPTNFSAVNLLVSVVPVATVGARLIDSYRATSFERNWQQQRLLALARDLASEIEPGRVVAKIIEHALGLVEAGSAVIAVRDGGRGVYRIEAADGPRAEAVLGMIGVEFPEDLPLIRRIEDEGTFEFPDVEPYQPVLQMMAEHGVQRVLYVALRYGGELMGILSFTRQAEGRFSAAERLLGRGLADQAALALRTARLVTDLRRANELKSEFVSTMSHELRTPLNVILGFAEMARDPVVPQAERSECLACIETAGRELLVLIESTLEIGKLEAGRENLQLETIALADFWAVLGRSCAMMPHARDVVLDWDTRLPAIAVVTDARKLALIVRNLVNNALKFTERGSVRADVTVADLAVVLRVADTGIGIRPEDHDTIFEMFRQADGSDSRRYGGTGLGLYIVRRFVQQLGGAIDLDSAPGRGSVFTVTLPRTAAARPVRDAA